MYRFDLLLCVTDGGCVADELSGCHDCGDMLWVGYHGNYPITAGQFAPRSVCVR